MSTNAHFLTKFDEEFILAASSNEPMKRQAVKTQFLVTGVLSCWLTLLSASGQTSVETNAAPNGSKPQESPNAQEILRAYLQLQEQVHATQLAIERSRREAEAAAMRNAEALSNRLEMIEVSMSAQREYEFDTMRSTNRTILIVAGSFAGLGFLAMVFTAWLQWRSANRLSELAASSHMPRALLPGWTMPALASGDANTAAESITAASGRLLDAVGQLEKRILALEHTATPPVNDAPDVEISSSADGSDMPADAGLSDKAARITLLLGKGQSLLNLEQNEEAMICFEKVIELDENNTEALVKKGVALERQRKLSEAIEYYDRAIAADSSMTIAYLYKGGIYNRLERFSEALECYEQALRTQEKRRPS